MIILDDDLDLSVVDGSPEGTPWIGWDNIVTPSNIAATTEQALFPDVNLANPATYLMWRGGSAGGNDSFTKVLLHMDGTDASTTFTDSNSGGGAHTWTANGNAQIDTGESVFGGASGLFDGVGDFVSTPDSAHYTLSTSDFTIDCWFKCTAAGGTLQHLCGQTDSTLTAAGTSFRINRTIGNVMEVRVCQGGGDVAFNGVTQFTNTLNTGWHHLAYVRSGNVFYLFIDGVLEGTTTFAATVNDSTSTLCVGRAGAHTSNTWTGSIDEWRMSVGTARWTETFTPPSAPYGASDEYITITTGSTTVTGSDDIDYLAVARHNFGTIGAIVSVEGKVDDGNSPEEPYTEIVQQETLIDDTPVIFRFVPQTLTHIRLRLQLNSAVPQAAVVYVGRMLVLERSIKLESDHVPLRLARKRTILNGMSQSGNFVGNIELKEFRESAAEFSHFTPLWYRANFDPFLQEAIPFFFAWHPVTYPEDVGYAWLTNDPMPEHNPATGRIAVDLQMRGIA